MPLSDFFKRSPKKDPAPMQQKESVNPPVKDDSLLSPEMQKKRYNAAMEFVKIFQEKIPLVSGKPHAGTVLSVGARLAGSSLYRSLNSKKEINPGTVVLSEEVNEAWPQLLNVFAFYCQQNGLDVMAKPLVTTFPEQDKPRMNLEQVLAEYQTEYHEIMKKHGLNDLEGARAGMILCNILFEYHCKTAKDIDPFVATGIVAMGVIEGAKTAPPPLKSRSPSGAAASDPAQNKEFHEILKRIAQNSINGTGTRLVLGEGMTPMQEIMHKGGRYILLHPEVSNQLRQNNIDPFLVYETALRMEIASRIPLIEFIGVDVDTLLQTWSGKPEAQAPIHIRQALWLQSHAHQFGYEKRGNRWILKQ